MRLLDLFSGIGGFALAARWVWGEQLEIVGFCEKDKFCQQILRKNFPGVPIHCEIKTFKTKEYKGTIELVTGGIPCQPFSNAGKQAGIEDDRYLWKEMLRIIKEVESNCVIVENVAGIINMALDQVLSDLESASYETQTFIIPACGLNAPHRRNRVWVIAYSKSENDRISDREKENGQIQQPGISDEQGIATNSDSKRLQTRETSSIKEKQTRSGIINNWTDPWYEVTTKFCRVDDGIPRRMDRLKSLGNAIVPQVAQVIMQSIKETGV